jgi:hypothetical protein
MVNVSRTRQVTLAQTMSALTLKSHARLAAAKGDLSLQISTLVGRFGLSLRPTF